MQKIFETKITKDVLIGSTFYKAGDTAKLRVAELDSARGSYTETKETKAELDVNGPLNTNEMLKSEGLLSATEEAIAKVEADRKAAAEKEATAKKVKL